MKKEAPIIKEIWAHIDKELSPETKQDFDQKLKKEETLRKEWLERNKLDQSLKTLETESPSMRFTANLMERLVKILPKRYFQPLIPKVWVKVFQFVGIVFGISLLYIILKSIWNIFHAREALNYPGAETISHLIENSSNQFFLIIGTLSFAYIALGLIDRYFSTR